MNRIHFIILMALMAIFSTFGGMISVWFLSGSDVFAAKNTPAKVIEAQEFRIVDPTGKVRGKFSLLFDEYPALVMRHKDGGTAIALGVAPDGFPSLTFADQAAVRAELGFLKETESTKMLGLRFVGQQGKPRIYVGVDSDDIPISVLSDKRGLPRLAYSVTSADRPNISLWDSRAKVIWTTP